MTLSAKIQNATLELLSDERPHDIQAIKGYLKANGISGYSAGQFSGSINTMVRNKSIKKVGRGLYVAAKGGAGIKKCFVVSPIGEAGSDVRKNADKLFRYIIEPVCNKCSFEAIRADQLNDAGSITDAIINYLDNSELVIADVSSDNPNVFYEIGYRARTKKPIIHLKAKNEALPFDITAIRAFEYDLTDLDSVDEIKDRLERTVQMFDYSGSGEAPEGDKSETGSSPILPVLYEILDKVNKLGDGLKNINADIISTVIKSMQGSQPQLPADAVLQMQLLGGLMQNPDGFAKLTELYEKLPHSKNG